MFDFLQNLTKSAEEKRQETIAAYVDGALNGRSRQQFEQEMAQDSALRLEVEQLQLIKQSLRQLPQREVPRNFILDPAEFSRPPARQPWVQAYPVLRTATAMAAFFFIFAVATSIFTSSSVGSTNSAAPAADVAQVQATIEVPEVEESLAFEAEAAVAEEAADAEMADEEMAADTAVDADDFAEAEEAMAEVETVEEEAEEAVAADEMPASDEPAAAPQEEMAEDGEVAPQATAVPTDSPAPKPTPTVSIIPRITSPTLLPDRDLELAEEAEDAADEVVADLPDPAVEDETVDVGVTAVLPEEEMEEMVVEQPANPLLWLQIGLGGLLILLLGLTFYARRQR